jgi:hypothetical protein
MMEDFPQTRLRESPEVVCGNYVAPAGLRRQPFWISSLVTYKIQS